MILRRIVLENFRQFRGIQEIRFVAPELSGSNVAVIFGENGRGKTGIFRAVVFCLFGERKLSQDGDIAAQEIQLVNTSALLEDTRRPVKTSVELEFSHKNTTYTMRRVLAGMLDNDRILEEITEIRLLATDSLGNTKIVSGSDVQGVINSILDRRVKDYFLFDGEKIERLTRATVEQRQEISRGIRNLLDVDALEKAIACMKKVTKSLDGELSAASSEELARLLNRLRDNESKQAELRSQLEELAEQSRLARKEIVDTDRELDKYKEIRHLLERRKSLESELDSRNQEAGELLSEMHESVTKAATLIVAPVVTSVFDQIEAQKQRGEIPSEIRRDLIDRIIEEGECICGRPLAQGTNPYERILEWRERTSDVSVQDAALNLWRYLGDVKHHFGDSADAVERRLLHYANIKNSVVDTQHNLELVRAEIGTQERADAARLDEHRRALEDHLIRVEAQALAAQSQLSQAESENERFKARLKEEKAKVDRNNDVARRSLLARETLDAMTEVHDQFTDDIKSVIGETATEYLRLLLDREGRESLRTVVVNPDYSIQVLDRWKRPFLANISAGQRQVLSISFIAALAKAASRSSRIDMPLFMDTPFGRLSSEHRRNLIRNVPEFASQWILLATDTEFRRQEARLLRETGKWAKFYELRPVDDGSTVVVEHEMDSVVALLGEGEAQ